MNSHSARNQTVREEVANAISHGIGFGLAVASLPFLLVFADRRGTAADMVGATLFASSMILLYGISCLYHALAPGRAKRVFNRLDHAAIFILIAGSYMPYLLGVLRGPWGWTLFGIVWGVAAFGVLAKLFNRLRNPLWSTGLYVAMGWVALIAVVPMFERLPGAGLAWLVAGGLAYTLGALVFLLDTRFRYGHFVWHLFVMTGSACHFFGALWYAV